ncbi:hypothetical protein NQ314_006863 [Rhamnusium bicolor]|uniref:Uncharacterized protein n=1 Tax=Rhamnusium bicolor TaxID=1586634 RepID=A0AAV8YWC3_9CUCU|nr:hypothetical protein NQ314_006863 [Rhamnusium bicolor]
MEAFIYLRILLGGHVKAVFTLITIIFVVCVTYTITSFKEMPLYLLELRGENFQREEEESDIVYSDNAQKYGSVDEKEEGEEDSTNVSR